MDRYALLITIKQGWGLRKKEIILALRLQKNAAAILTIAWLKRGPAATQFSGHTIDTNSSKYNYQSHR